VRMTMKNLQDHAGPIKRAVHRRRGGLLRRREIGSAYALRKIICHHWWGLMSCQIGPRQDCDRQSAA
jgi:hypothetical protein